MKLEQQSKVDKIVEKEMNLREQLDEATSERKEFMKDLKGNFMKDWEKNFEKQLEKRNLERGDKK